MHFFKLALAFAGVTSASVSLKHLKYDRRFTHAERAPGTSRAFIQDDDVTEKAPQFLNDKTKKFAVHAKNLPMIMPDVGKAFGESYAGLLPTDEGDGELYFWFFPSDNPAAKNEITIWLNGGPGCSSLDGLFHENGPVIWQAGTYRPTSNTYTWKNLTNMVWVEQPVGTGFTKGTVTAKDEVDVARQFRGFWKNFVDLFDLHHRKVYVTGESYAGQYVPYIADGFLNQTNTKYFDVNGILIYDPSIGDDTITEQVPAVAFADSHAIDFPFNDTFRKTLHQKADDCGFTEYLEKGLKFPPPQKGLAPAPKTKGCHLFAEVINGVFEINPCFDIYQVGQACPIPWDVLGFPASNLFLPPGFNQPYFNRTDVRKIINAPLHGDWAICTGPVFSSHGGRDQSPPSATGEHNPLQRVTEKTNNVIVGHGLLDMVLIANGTLLTLNNMTWNGARGFSKPPTKPFYVPYHYDPVAESVAGAGVFGSWVSERGLTFVTIDFSGHEVPEYQPSAAYRHLELLLGRIKNLAEVSAFTTQPGFPQSNQKLGKGTGNLLPGHQ